MKTKIHFENPDKMFSCSIFFLIQKGAVIQENKMEQSSLGMTNHDMAKARYGFHSLVLVSYRSLIRRVARSSYMITKRCCQRSNEYCVGASK